MLKFYKISNEQNEMKNTYNTQINYNFYLVFSVLKLMTYLDYKMPNKCIYFIGTLGEEGLRS